MISLHFQGGCDCENAAGLRRCTDNAEMCAMIAPRPLFLAGSTGDWTNYLETTELPAMLETYRQYGAEDLVEHFYQDAIHQYNEKTRHRVYSFFARHLMGRELNWTEQPIEVNDLQALTWFGGKGEPVGETEDAAFFAFHKAERTAAAAALSDEEKRRMLRWITGVNASAFPRGQRTAFGGKTVSFSAKTGRRFPSSVWCRKTGTDKKVTCCCRMRAKHVLHSPMCGSCWRTAMP